MICVYQLHNLSTPASHRPLRANLSWLLNIYFFVTFPYYEKPHKDSKSTLSEAEPAQFESKQELYTEAMSQAGQIPAQLQGSNGPRLPAF